jgi:hypothetical protein
VKTWFVLSAVCGVAFGLILPVPRPFDPVVIANLKAENQMLRDDAMSRAGEEDVMAKLAITCFNIKAKEGDKR